MKAYAQRICALLILIGPAWAFAAEPAMPAPDRLPDDTWILVNWHGVANASRVRDSNPVLKLWHDPQFAKVRDQLVEQISGSLKEGSATERRAATDDVLSILENPLVIGISGDPFVRGIDGMHLFRGAEQEGQGSGVDTPAWQGQAPSRLGGLLLCIPRHAGPQDCEDHGAETRRQRGPGGAASATEDQLHLRSLGG